MQMHFGVALKSIHKSLDWDFSWGCNCTWLPKTTS